MIGRRQAGRMRRSNRPLFLAEVQLRRKRVSQLRCGRCIERPLLRKPVNLLLGNVVSCLTLQVLTLRNRLQPHVFLLPIQAQSPSQVLLLLYPSYQFVIFAGFRYLFVIGPLTNAAQYDVIESLSVVAIAPEIELRATSKRG